MTSYDTQYRKPSVLHPIMLATGTFEHKAIHGICIPHILAIFTSMTHTLHPEWYSYLWCGALSWFVYMEIHSKRPIAHRFLLFYVMVSAYAICIPTFNAVIKCGWECGYDYRNILHNGPGVIRLQPCAVVYVIIAHRRNLAIKKTTTCLSCRMSVSWTNSERETWILMATFYSQATVSRKRLR